MKKMFKILIAIILALCISVPCLALSTYKDSSGKQVEYDDDFFEFGYFNETMRPKADYFIPLYYDGIPLDDNFFAEFTTRFGFISTCSLSNIKFKSFFDVVEWVRDDQGRYYLHMVVRDATSTKEYDGQIVVYATDRYDSDYRAIAVADVCFSYDKSYSTGSSSVKEDKTEIDFVCDGGIIKFDKEVDGKYVKAEVGDDITVSFKIDYTEKYNLLYDDYVSNIIKAYNSKAKIRQFNFYGNQTFSSTCNVKFKIKNGERYLYELSDSGELTYLGGEPSEVKTMGVGTNRLGTYILSDTLLNPAPYLRISEIRVDPTLWVPNPNTGTA